MDHRRSSTRTGVRLRGGSPRGLVVAATAAIALVAGVVLAVAAGHIALASGPNALSVTSARGANQAVVRLDSAGQPRVREQDATPTPSSTPVSTPTPTPTATPTSVPSGGAPGSSPDPTPVPSVRTNTPSTGADLPFGAGILLILGGLALFAARRRSDTL
jgi:hypothetical protein